MKQYSFIITNRTFSVKDESDLELLFKLFANSKISSVIHWNIIMEIDSDLEKIIKTYKWLLKCLKHLNEKNTFLLLVKIWDILSTIITRSWELWELLAKIPEESNKFRLLSTMRLKWLSKIIKNPHDLWNVLEWLYWDKQKDFLDLLWKEYIKKLFLSTNEIIMTLYYLNDDNKDYLIDLIWFEWVKNKVKTKDNFLVLFNWLSVKKAKLLLRSFSKEDIVNFFSSESDFYRFMLKLSFDREKIFLKHLWL